MLRPVVIALVATLTATSLGCGKRAPEGVEAVRIENANSYYQDEGFTQLVPPIHYPTSASDIEQVEIWMKLPGQAMIGSEMLDGAARLKFPAGTRVDRVEFGGRAEARKVVDVRGAIIEADGTQLFHVYRPSGPDASDPMVGVRWPAEDAATAAAATDHFIEGLRTAWPATTMKPEAREKMLKAVGQKNRCLPCHNASRPDNAMAGQHGLVNRGTDVSGFFVPTTVFQDETVLESYGRFDRSLQDPAIEIRCGNEIVPFETLDQRRCPGGEIPVGVWKWEEASTLNPTRAEQVCKSRLYLGANLDPSTRERFSTALEKCERT